MRELCTTVSNVGNDKSNNTPVMLSRLV